MPDSAPDTMPMIGRALDRAVALAKRLPRPSPAWWWLAPAAAAAILLYYPVGMALVHHIDDDPAFRPDRVAAGASRTTAMAAALILREVDGNHWTPNDPFFQPSWALDNMPAFQQGLVGGAALFVFEMNARVGRNHISGASGTWTPDADLDRAAGLLKYPATVWMFDPSTSWAPTASSEKQYRAAARALEIYNQRLAAGEASFERQADALRPLLDRIAKDLDTLAEASGRQVDDGAWLVDTDADDAFYAAKGRLYAYSLLLPELGADFSDVLAGRNLGGAWRRAEASLAAAAALDPMVVTNGAPDATLMPNHLAAQGFFALRAGGLLTDIAQALAK